MRNQAEANLSALIESTEDLIWSVDLDYRLILFNSALRRNIHKIYGVQLQAGMRFYELLPPERAALWPPYYARALLQGPFSSEYSLPDGHTLELSFNPIVADGKAVGVSVFGKDITNCKQTTQALSESEARLRGFFDGNGSVMLLVDPENGEIFYANQAAVEYYGYTLNQLIGMPVSRINALPPPEIFCQFQQALRKERVHFDFRHRLASGEERDVEVYSSPIHAQGRTLLFSIVHDITERKQAEKAHQESEEFLRESQKAAGLGSYALDLRTRTWSSSEALDAIFGIGSDYPRDVAGWTALIDPDDRARMATYFEDDVARDGKPFDQEYRIVRQTDRAVRWVHGMGRLEFDALRQPLKMSGIIHDITARKLSEMQLRESEERFRATFEQAAVGIIHTSFEGRILRCNSFFADFLGYAAEEITGLTVGQITAPEDSDASAETLEQIRNGSAAAAGFEKRYLRKDGTPTWAKLTVSVQRDAEGRALHLVSVVEDINARKAAEVRLALAAEALQLSEARYRTAFQTSIDAININRLSDGKYIDCNQAFLDTTGYRREEILGLTSPELGIWADVRDRQTMVEMVRRNGNFRGLEAQFRKKNGELFWGEMSASVVEIDGVACILSITRDLSSAKEAEDTIRSLAFYDPLTGLPNRRLLLERLRQPLDTGARDGRSQALLLVDLDHFKTVNDTLGHQAGDLMLKEVARRVAAAAHADDTVCRLGGDEFVVMLEDLSEVAEQAAAQAKAVGEHILAAIDRPFSIENRERLLTASIGIIVFGNRQSNTEEVLQQADIALDQAKAAGRNTLRFFSPALQAAVNARAVLEQELRQAIKTNQFLLYYQPQVERNHVRGAEALIRWQHPVRGLVPPDEFIPLAEESRLILPLGDWVLETACAQIASWAGQEHTAHLTVAVNISALQFRQPEFVEQVLSALDRTGANPKNLRLELTESMLAENIDEVIAKMTELKSHGLRFSLDDFGTGYSSLAYLKRLPLDSLKVDRAFVRDILIDETSGAIAQTILSLGRAMGLSVIAEGVETEEQRGFLAAIGCHSFQGYLFSRPLPLEQFQAFVLNFAKSYSLR
jgi:diguanylate cyclase (GGDEF)-like protein/PAS domain S-box-containing protein